MVSYKRDLGLPLGIKENPVFAKRCLRGIFDTDGTLYLEKKNKKLYPRIQIKSVSKILIEDIKNILKSNDFSVSLWKEIPKKDDWKTSYTIAIRGHKQVSKWMNAIGTNNTKNTRKI